MVMMMLIVRQRGTMMARHDNQRDERAAMELYTAGTGNGQRAAIAVNECGVACTMHVLNLAQGDQRKPDYLKINPTARIRP
jgi:glutathione S-transferase